MGIEIETAQLNKDFRRLFKKTKSYSRARDIHDMRVTLRKLQACQWLNRHGGTLTRHRKLKAHLRRLSHQLGATRKWDVLLKDAEQLDLPVKKIKRHQRIQHRQLYKILKKRFSKNIKTELKSFRQELSDHAPFEKDAALLFLQAEFWDWPTSLPTDKKLFHKLRLAVKKMNYRLTFLNFPHSLPEAQKEMGRVHDLEELEKEFPHNSEVQALLSASVLQATRTYRRIHDELVKFFQTLE